MSQKKQPNNRIRYCVLICESLYSDYDNISPFSELGNYSAIDYTINWLVDNDIDEIFMFYSNSKTQVEEYHAQTSKIIDAKLHLHYMKSSEFKSFGDVIREVHFRNLLSQDFLVMYADNITNLSLSDLTNNHFKKKIDLKNVVLTTAMRKGLSSHIYVLNSSTSEILQIDHEANKQFSLNTQKINLKKLNVQIRRDIVPLDIFILTVQVVTSFKQNYQYATMQDFILGMLTSEIYEQKINAYEIKHTEISYRLNRASSVYHCYMNFVCGYLSPYTIYADERMGKLNRNGGDHLFSVRKYNKIFRKGTLVSDSVVLSNNVYIGQNSKIQNGCKITKSIVGKNCVLDKNVVLKNCIILDGCTICQNSYFQYCLIEKVNETVKIHNFKADIFEQFQKTIDRKLFMETPEPEQVTIQEELSHLLSDKPQEETILVSELVRIRKQFSLTESEFTMQIIKMLKPQGVKGIETMTDQWGTVLYNVHHEDEQELISSLYYACTKLEDYLKAFHLILQYFYHFDILGKQAILEWFGFNQTNTVTLSLCTAFIQKLQEEQNEDEDEYGEDDDQN